MLDWSPARIRREYRAAYAEHARLSEAYAAGNATMAQLASSADYLSRLKALHRIATEPQPA